MQVIIFEDEKALRFKPLCNLKPVYGLRCGCSSLKEKFDFHSAGKTPLSYHLRKYLARPFSEENPGALVNTVQEEDILLVNGRLLCDERVAGLMLGNAVEPGTALMQGDNLLFCRTGAASLLTVEGSLPDLIEVGAITSSMKTAALQGFTILDNIWDIIAFHPEAMQREARALELGRNLGTVHPAAVLVNPSNIYIGDGAVIKAGAVLDADDGFIHVGAGTVVEPQAVLMQNVFLAPRSTVKIGAKIYSNVYVGTASKAGGEIEDSIIEPCANKQHDGFLGHSYLSSWCNLGAGTNTSDLKNNYSRVGLVIDNRQLATNLQFLGLLMGEHSKSSINSMFNTGTVVGTAANIFGGGMPPKFVPSFSWGSGATGFEPYQIDKAVETARKVMERRKLMMSDSYEEMFRLLSGFETLQHVLQ